MKVNEINNSFEIINDFIVRYSFYSCFNDGSFLFPKKLGEKLPLKNKKVLDYMIYSALTGNKVIGFFDKLPPFDNKYLLRGDCIFVTKSLPEKILTPTLFCRKPEEIIKMFLLAANVSNVSKLPVVIVMSDNAINGFAYIEKYNLNQDRITPYVSQDTFKKVINEKELEMQIALLSNIFAEAFIEKNSNHEFSFKDHTLSFFNYMLPFNPTSELKTLSKRSLEIPEDEVDDITKLIKNSYQIELKVTPVPYVKKNVLEEFLCPGCPFVNIFARRKDKSAIYFTDINCKALRSVFDIDYLNIESYMGIVSNKLNVPSVFISNVSNYKPVYQKALHEKNVILLSDFDSGDLKGFLTLKHPKKFVNNKNILYPYSCNNIKKYSKVNVNLKKCKCSINNEQSACVNATRCPALTEQLGKVKIDHSLCNGCLTCQQTCKYGAI